MKILCLSACFPVSAGSAGSSRLYCLARELARRHDLILVCFAGPNDNQEPNLDCQTVFKRIINLPPPGPPTWTSSQIHRFFLEADCSFKYRHPQFLHKTRSFLGQLIESERVDVVVAHGIEMVQILPVEDTLPVIIDAVDSMSLYYNRACDSEDRILRKLALKAEEWAVARIERRAARRCRLMTFVSAVDAAWVKFRSGIKNPRVIPLGTDTDYFKMGERPLERRDLVFVGVMNYPPNIDAAIWFANEVFPLIQANHPELRFVIVGKDPVAEVSDLSRLPGVVVTGSVEDVRPFMSSALCVVAPLRLGAGVKHKILNAMACGVPVIATSLSMEGIEAEVEEHFLLANTPAEFLGCVEKLLNVPDMAKKMGTNTRALVLGKYSWQSIGERFEGLLYSTVTEFRRERRHKV